ncbi:class I SAM-dependent methyltransferase [Candidatus Omnitrophota bacterium]
MLCKICQGITRFLGNPRSERRYYACNECDFIFLDEQYIIDKDEERRRYSLHNNTFENEGYVKMFKDFIEQVIEPYKHNVSTALDFGCGTTPVLATLLKEKIPTVHHYDPYFYPNQELKDATYDVITATEVLEHLKDPLFHMRKLVDLLAPGGLIGIMTLFHPRNDEEFLTWWYRKDETHIAFYSEKTFDVISKILGITIVYCNDKNHCLLQKQTT